MVLFHLEEKILTLESSSETRGRLNSSSVVRRRFILKLENKINQLSIERPSKLFYLHCVIREKRTMHNYVIQKSMSKIQLSNLTLANKK